jgi:PPM family protein phosphatase
MNSKLNWNFHYAALTDVGRRRKQNQDQVGASPEIGLFFVADGMGGHQGGETASQLAAETLPSSLKASLSTNPDIVPAEALTQAIKHANQNIYLKAQENSELHGMGTTVTSVIYSHDRFWIGHVGDSRSYLIRKNEIWQLTKDHSLVEEKVRAGLLKREDISTDHSRNVITRSVGFEPQIQVEIYDRVIDTQDLLLICSDGLTGHLSDQEIQETVKKGFYQDKKSLQDVAKILIQKANDAGGDDNISVVLVQPFVADLSNG